MALSAPLKALALVVFIAALGSATYGVTIALGDTVSSQLVGMEPVREQLNATAGHTVAFAVTVTNRDASSKDLHVEIEGPHGLAGTSAPQTVRSGANATYFVPVAIPGDVAAGDLALTAIVAEGEHALRTKEGALALRILAPAPGVEPGDRATVIYTGSLASTGRVFNTNDAMLVGLNFLRTDTYRFSAGLFPVQTDPPSVVDGFHEALMGMQPGESRTVTFPPEKGYGPAADEETVPRHDDIERTFSLRNEEEQVGRDVFDSYVSESGQGEGSAYSVGDVFTFQQGGNRWPYRITNMSGSTVGYVLAAEVGQTYTIFPFWPNASEVRAVNDTHVEFYTTPTTAIGEPISMKTYWPDMSAVAAINETHITVRHSPPQGFKYMLPTSLGQQAETTVKEVGEDEIVLATPSSHPLAGKDLTFDILLVELTKAPK